MANGIVILLRRMWDFDMFGEKHEKQRTWKQAMQLLQAVYALTSQFPKSEQKTLAHPLRQKAMHLPRQLAIAYRQNERDAAVQRLVKLLPTVHEVEDYLAVARQLRLAGAWRIGSACRGAARLRKLINDEIDQHIQQQTIIEEAVA